MLDSIRDWSELEGLPVSAENKATEFKREYVDDTMLRITNAIRDAVRPDITIFAACRNGMMDGRGAVSVAVHTGTARLWYLHGKGILPGGANARQGASGDAITGNAIYKKEQRGTRNVLCSYS